MAPPHGPLCASMGLPPIRFVYLCVHVHVHVREHGILMVFVCCHGPSPRRAWLAIQLSEYGASESFRSSCSGQGRATGRGDDWERLGREKVDLGRLSCIYSGSWKGHRRARMFLRVGLWGNSHCGIREDSVRGPGTWLWVTLTEASRGCVSVRSHQH